MTRQQKKPRRSIYNRNLQEAEDRHSEDGEPFFCTTCGNEFGAQCEHWNSRGRRCRLETYKAARTRLPTAKGKK